MPEIIGLRPGHGGVLPGTKVTAEIAAARSVPVGVDCVSPAQHSALTTPLRMIRFIAELRELSGGKATGFKFCIGHPWEFMGICKAMLETGIKPDFIVIDGTEGGAGVAPLEVVERLCAKAWHLHILPRRREIARGDSHRRRRAHRHEIRHWCACACSRPPHFSRYNFIVLEPIADSWDAIATRLRFVPARLVHATSTKNRALHRAGNNHPCLAVSYRLAPKANGRRKFSAA